MSCAIGKLVAGRPGAYVLMLRLRRPARLRIGQMGLRTFPSGWYLYIGSALGPGGVAARVARHLRTDKRTHWHIDYLLGAGPITRVWITFDRRVRECSLARRVQSLPGVHAPVPGFGATDCDCTTHLFRFNRRPQFAGLLTFDLTLSSIAFRAAVSLVAPRRST